MQNLRKTLAIVLALLIALSSVSALGFAVDGAKTIIAETKFFRKVGAEWVETTKAMKGESVKARVYLTTDFVVGASTVAFLYSKDSLAYAGKETVIYDANTQVKVYNANASKKNALVEKGYLTEGVFNDYELLFVILDKGLYKQYTADNYAFEFDFKVLDDVTTDSKGNLYIPKSCIAKDGDSVATNFPSVDAAAAGTSFGVTYKATNIWKYNLSLADTFDSAQLDEPSTLTFGQKITLDGNSLGTVDSKATKDIEGVIGSSVSEAIAGISAVPSGKYSFEGWGKDGTTADDLTDEKFDYNEKTYKAAYSATVTYEFTGTVPAGRTAPKAVKQGLNTSFTPETITVDTESEKFYSFGGWKNGDNNVTGSFELTENTTLKGEWTFDDSGKEYKVTFNAGAGLIDDGNGGKVKQVIKKYKNGEAIEAPTIYPPEGKNGEWKNVAPTMGTSDLEYTASYSDIPVTEYKINVNVDGEKYCEPITVTVGETILDKLPTVTPDIGKKFDGWKIDAQEVTAATVMPSSDITVDGTTSDILYHWTWKIDTATVGEDDYKYEDAVSEPVVSGIPTGKHVEWNEYPQTAPANEVTVYGRYVNNVYTVTFNAGDGLIDDGNEGKVKKVVKEYNYNDAIVTPTIFAPEGFSGKWEGVAETMGTDNLEYTAKYTAITPDTFAVTVKVDGKVYGNTLYIKAGEKILDYLPTVTLDIGKKFDGWKIDAQEVTAATVMPSSDITVDGTTSDILYHWTWKIDTATVGEADYKYEDAVSEPVVSGIPTGKHIEWNEYPQTAPANEVTVYGSYVNNVYTVTFNAGTGLIDDGNEGKVKKVVKEYNYNDAIVTPTIFAPEGFIGKWEGVAETMGTDNLEYTAQYEALEGKAIFKGNGGKIFDGSKLVDELTFEGEYSDTIEVPEYDAERKGHDFLGWAKSASAADGENIYEDTYGTGKVYYAVWDVMSFDITFNANGGKFEDSDTEKTVDTKFGEVPSIDENPAKAGNEFKGWAEVPTAKQPTTINAISEELLEGKIYYAVYSPNTYTLTFDANGGEWDGEEKIASPIKYGEFIEEPGETPTRDGYTFLGWSEDDEATKDMGTLPEKFEAEQDVTYYAVWSPKYVRNAVKFLPNGGEWEDQVTEKYVSGMYNDLLDETPDDIVRYGYDFIGWGEKPDDKEGVNIYESTLGELNGKVFYALWEAMQGTAVFDATDGAFEDGKLVKEVTITFGEDITAPETAVKREGYEFKGWNTNPKAKTGVTLGTVTEEPYEKITYFAIWSIKMFDVEFNAGEGTWEEGNKQETSVLFNTAVEAPAINPEREGYTFEGWADENGKKVDFSEPITKEPTGKLVYNAIWKEFGKIFYIVDNKLVNTVSLKAGTTISEYTPAEKTGYVFDCWKDANGNTYSVMPENDLYLFAYFNAKTGIHVKFIEKDGTLISNDTYTYGQKITAPKAKEIDDYVFTEFKSDEGVVFDGVCPAEDITFRAQYTEASAVTFTVTFYVDGKEVETKKYEVGDTIVYPNVDDKEFDTFEGWVSRDSQTYTTMPKKDLEFDAKFEAIPVKLIPSSKYSEAMIERDGIVETYNTVTNNMQNTGVTDIIAPVTKTYNTTIKDYDAANAVKENNCWYIYGIGYWISEETFRNTVKVQGNGYFTVTKVNAEDDIVSTGALIKVYEKVEGGEDRLVETFHVVLFGDINGDGMIGTEDSGLVLSEIEGQKWSGANVNVDRINYLVKAADLDRSGSLEVNDLTAIRQALTGGKVYKGIDQKTGAK